MKAHELYDHYHSAVSNLSRREYYNQMRTAMRQEAALGECRLIARMADAVAAGQKELYLLDAGALWECYDDVLGGGLPPRNDSRGFPFHIRGHILPWSEIQRLDGENRLPAAAVDDVLRARVQGLNAYLQGQRGLPPVNPRLPLLTVEPAAAETIYHPNTIYAGTPRASFTSPLRQQVAGTDGRKLDLQALMAENSLLRGQLEQLRSYRENERSYAVQAARSILSGHVEEARAIAEKLDSELQELLADLEKLTALRLETEQRLAALRGQIEADNAQACSLKEQQEAAEKEAAQIRARCAEAQQQAGQARQEKEAAENELTLLNRELEESMETLRALRVKAAQAAEANGMTQRQIESMSGLL